MSGKTVITLKAGEAKISDLRKIARSPSIEVKIDISSVPAIKASCETVEKIISEGKTVYGINTGFGLLANTKISDDQLAELQQNIVISHAAGTGPYLSNDIVKLIMVLKSLSLMAGYSGVRLEVIQTLICMVNHNIFPLIPSKGSVGASGDLAPLAHMSLALIGIGNVRHNDKIVTAKDALKSIGLTPLVLAPKEGLALLNGTQVSTALALIGLFHTQDIFSAALVSGAMTVDAAKGSDAPLDARIHKVRGQKGQIETAKVYRELLEGSEIRASHIDCSRVQDPYCIRCQPQVMGACLDMINFVSNTLETEANAATDNPLVFSEEGDVLSGGNFHAEPIAMAADTLAIAVAEIGAIAERRIAMLIDPNISKLPPFLVENSGLNSGFMLAQVTAAALASENKSRAHPASVDSLPTSANQEDHVSMATFAARRILNMTDNTAGILAIELLAAAQGIDFHRPKTSSAVLEHVHSHIRKHVSMYDRDRFFSPDIEKMKALIKTGYFNGIASVFKIDIPKVEIKKPVKTKAEKKQHDLKDLTRKAISECKSFAGKNRTRIVFKTVGNDAFINVDGNKITDVIKSLLLNAIKSSEQGGQVEIIISRFSDMLQLTITDYGLGIPISFRDSIFDKKEETPEQPETGIGLAVCRTYIEEMGGAINFTTLSAEETILGVGVTMPTGTSFFFRLPELQTQE